MVLYVSAILTYSASSYVIRHTLYYDSYVVTGQFLSITVCMQMCYVNSMPILVCLLKNNFYEAPKIGFCDFGPFSETCFTEILGGTKKLNTPPHDTLQTSSFQMV